MVKLVKLDAPKLCLNVLLETKRLQHNSSKVGIICWTCFVVIFIRWGLALPKLHF